MVVQPVANRYTDYAAADVGASWNNIVKWTTVEFVCVTLQHNSVHSVLGIQCFSFSCLCEVLMSVIAEYDVV
jgi:hypothetical protein